MAFTWALCSSTQDACRWSVPPVFSWLHREGGLSEEEMARTFNCGLGAVLVASPSDAERVVRQLQAEEEAWIVGSLVHKQPGETLRWFTSFFCFLSAARKVFSFLQGQNLSWFAI